jgi:hypothetical protein
MAGSTPREVEDVVEILDKEFKYFLRLHDIAETLQREEEKGDKKDAIDEFKTLEKFERKEQWRVPVGNLISAVKKILPLYPPAIGKEIETHVVNMGRLEARVLIETVEQLEPELEAEGAINWEKVVKITEKIIKFLEGLIYVDRETRKLVEPKG